MNQPIIWTDRPVNSFIISSGKPAARCSLSVTTGNSWSCAIPSMNFHRPECKHTEEIILSTRNRNRSKQKLLNRKLNIQKRKFQLPEKHIARLCSGNKKWMLSPPEKGKQPIFLPL